MQEEVTVFPSPIEGIKRRKCVEMKRIIEKTMLILIVVTLLPLQFTGSFSKAEELIGIENGNYEVELSFLLAGNDEQETLFDTHATLRVNDGRFTLLVPIKPEEMLITLNAKQQDESIPVVLNLDEKRAQFELKNLHQNIIVEGTAKSTTDEQIVSFTKEFKIESESLPKEEPEIEKPTPKPEPTPEPEKPEIPIPPVIEDEEEERPEPENPLKYKEINYILLTDGKKEPSIMNTYVNPIMKVTKKKSGFDAQMEILKSSWITGLKIEQNGKLVEPKEISLVDNTRVIQFEVKDLYEKVRLWVKVDIPEISYAHEYFVELLFDQEQANGFEDSNSNDKTEVEESVNHPIKKPAQTNPNQLQSSVVKKAPSKSFQSPTLPQQKPPISKGISKPVVAASDEQLTFDRTLDEMIEDEDTVVEESQDEIEVTQPVNQVNEEKTPFDKVKIGVLISLILLSGVLLIRRFKNRKKDVASGG